jgi:hypothetical protein
MSCFALPPFLPRSLTLAPPLGDAATAIRQLAALSVENFRAGFNFR